MKTTTILAVITFFLIGLTSGLSYGSEEPELVCVENYWDEENLTQHCVRGWFIDHENCIWEPLDQCALDQIND